MLPTLTPLQYLVLHLLFVGPQTGVELRRTLRTLGVKQSGAAFSRLMMRLVDGNYVSPQVCSRRTVENTIRECRYEITDIAVFDWLEARKFYLNLSPPSDDLVPVVTESGELAGYDPALRKSVIDKRFKSDLKSSLALLMDNLRQNSRHAR